MRSSPPNALFKGRHRAELTRFSPGAATPLASIAAERAARKIVRACRRGSARLIITPQARAASLVNELAPELVTRALSLLNALLPPRARARRLDRGAPRLGERRPARTLVADAAPRRGRRAEQRAAGARDAGGQVTHRAHRMT